MRRVAMLGAGRISNGQLGNASAEPLVLIGPVAVRGLGRE